MPVVALSAGCGGDGRNGRGLMVVTPSIVTELLGRVAQMASDTTRKKRP